MKDVTTLLRDAAQGNKEALDRVVPLIFDELRNIARRHMQAERRDHTLQPTALVNEVYCRLVGDTSIDYHDRNHFFAIASRRMREILINHAKRKQAQKRGDGWQRIPFELGKHELQAAAEFDLEDIVALDDALSRLESRPGARAQRMSKMVELRLFGGMTAADIAAYLKLSVRTVERELRAAITVLVTDVSGGTSQEGSEHQGS